MKHTVSLTILLAGLISYIPPVCSMVAELESGIVAAVKKGSHSALIQALETHESVGVTNAAKALKNYMPNANQALGEVKTAAEMVNMIAGLVPGGASVAAVAGDIESVAAVAQQGLGGASSAAASTAGGSASTAAKNSPEVQAALDAIKAAQAGTGLSSRVFAGLISAGCLATIGVVAYVDWFSTNSSSSENKDEQRASAYISSGATFSGLAAATAASLYYAVTNKWYNDKIATAKVNAGAVTNHVNTTTAVTSAVAQITQPAAV